jgi:hypothetical protein
MTVFGEKKNLVTLGYERDTPEVDVFCAVSKEKFYGLFFFVESTFMGSLYVDVLTLWFLPQLEEDSKDFVFQLHGAPPHFHVAFRNHLNAKFPEMDRSAGASDVA